MLIKLRRDIISHLSDLEKIKSIANALMVRLWGKRHSHDCWRELGNAYQNFICFYILTHLYFVIITPIKTDPEDTAATV